MKVAKELPNTTNWSLLSNRALYLVATLPEKKNKQKKHAHKGRAILDDKKTNETRSINQFIRTKGETRDGYNNLKATHRLRIPNVLLL